MRPDRICVIRELSAFRRSRCSLSTLRFGDPTPTNPQVGGFASHRAFQSRSRARCSAFFPVLELWSRQLSAHRDCTSPVVGPLLAFPCRSRLRTFSHACLTAFSMPDSLCLCRKLANLEFKYRSSGGMYVSISSTAIGVALYAPATTRKHLFYTLTSL